MKMKIFVAVSLMAGVAGAVVHLTTAPPPIDILLVRPKSAGEKVPGTAIVDPGPVPAACREPSHITVLAYTSDSCPACIKLKTHLEGLLRMRPDVAVRIVDVGKRWGGMDYKNLYGIELRTVPHILIFDAEGELLAEDRGRDKAGLKLLYEWINAELRRNRP